MKTMRWMTVAAMLAALLVAAPDPAPAQGTAADRQREVYREYRERLQRLRDETREAERARQAAREAERQRLRDEYSIYRIETFENRGDSSRRVDIVFLSDGYTADEFADYYRASEEVAAFIMAQEPFRSYRNYINLHRISVVAERRGFPENTRFGANVNEHRMLTFADTSRVLEYAGFASDHNLVVVICNASDVRSTALLSTPGIVALAGQGRGNVGAVLLHELGHAFGKLADEYVDEPLAATRYPRRPTEEPFYTNVSIYNDPRRVKWHYWIGARTPQGPVGVFPGAAYHPEWFVRPQQNCLMRTSHRGDFCVVCMETMLVTMYDYIDPIDRATPHSARIALWKNESADFTAELVRIGGQVRASSRWLINGREAGRALRLPLRAAQLEPGLHEVTLTARIEDPRIRRDLGRMASVRGWTVEVLPYDAPTLTAPNRIQATQGETVTFDVRATGLDHPDLSLSARHLPPGATFDAQTGRFAWEVPPSVRGAFRVVFEAGRPGKTVSRAVDISIRGNRPVALDTPGNVRPVFDLPGEIEIDEGGRLEINVQAADADGDALVYSCEDLPEGAEFDHETGALVWQTGFLDSGRYRLRFRATDGQAQSNVETTLTVNDIGMQRPGALNRLVDLNAQRPTHDMYLALRGARRGGRRGGGLGPLGRAIDAYVAHYPAEAVFAELLRLSRDRSEGVRQEAFTRLSRIVSDAQGERRTQLLGMFCDLIEPHLIEYVDQADALTVFGGWIAEAQAATMPPHQRNAPRNARRALDRALDYNRARGIE